MEREEAARRLDEETEEISVREAQLNAAIDTVERAMVC